MRKKTFDEVKQVFADKGYQLLSNEYHGSKAKLDYLCPKGHLCAASLDTISSGHGCAFCVGNAKHSIEVIRKAFEARGYTLLSHIYIGAKRKLDCICPNDHAHSITWDDFKSGCGCSHCAKLSALLPIEHVEKCLNQRGYRLLDKEFKGNRHKVKSLCPSGHECLISFGQFKLGVGCAKCHELNRGKSYRGERHHKTILLVLLAVKKAGDLKPITWNPTTEIQINVLMLAMGLLCASLAIFCFIKNLEEGVTLKSSLNVFYCKDLAKN